MNKKKWSSSIIVETDYDEELSVLSVTYKGGSTYHYLGVLVDVFKEMMEAESIGSFITKRIKNIYSFNKIN